MSQHETATPSPKISITPAIDPAPPWTGVKFTCSECLGEFQLEAADRCTWFRLNPDSSRTYVTPACPTPGCVAINLFDLPAEKFPESGPVESADQVEGNAS